jgi:VanZ family protein
LEHVGVVVRWLELDWEVLESVARKASWLGIGLIAVASLLPGPQRPHIDQPGQIEHMLAYGLTSLVFFYGRGSRNAAMHILALSLYAGLLEAAQHLIPGRTPRFADFAASAVGVVLGALLAGLARFLRRSGLQMAQQRFPEPPTGSGRRSTIIEKARDVP